MKSETSVIGETGLDYLVRGFVQMNQINQTGPPRPGFLFGSDAHVYGLSRGATRRFFVTGLDGHVSHSFMVGARVLAG